MKIITEELGGDLETATGIKKVTDKRHKTRERKEKNMKYLKRLQFLAVIFIVSAWSITGCTGKESNDKNITENVNTETKEDTFYSVTDMLGNEITLDRVPEKMVVLLASDVEILYELGVQDTIVGVGEYCNYPKEAIEKEVISTGENLNIEQIIAMDPDVVIIGEMAQTTDQFKQFEKAGIPIVVTNSQDIASTYKAINLMGEISGKQKEARELVSNMKASFQEMEEKSTGNYEKSIYFEVSPLEYGLWTTGKDTFMQELADMLEVKNVFDDLSGWAEVSEEQVLERNPDYIVTSTMSYEGVSPVEEILNRGNWQNVAAIVNKQVYNGNSDMMTRPGPRLVDAAKELYEFIYGE